ncbi:hypothetical protein ACFL2Q_19170 [Thermodesulfobacteriota bacterium]
MDTSHGGWYAKDGGSWLNLGNASQEDAVVLDGNSLIQFRPDANWNGTVNAGITFKAWDGSDGLWSGASHGNAMADGGIAAYSEFTETAGITVNAVNDTPTAKNGGLPPVNVTEDAVDTVIDLSTYFTDLEDGSSLTYTVEGNWDANLFENVSISGSQLTIDYKDDANGADTLTIRGTDSGDGNDGAEHLDQSFSVNVAAVNDTPTVAGGGLPDVNVNEDAADTVIDLRNYFDDVEDGSSLTYTVQGTWDANLFDDVSISGSQLTIDYKDNGNGADTLTIRGTDSGEDNDGAEHLDQSFTVNVAPVNDTPTVDPQNGALPNVDVNEDAADTVIDLRTYFDDVEDGSSLAYTIEGTWDTSLFDASIGQDGYTLTIDYKDNANGADYLTIRGTDNGEGNDGAEHLDQSFLVYVAVVNDQPTVDPQNGGLPNVDVNEDAPNTVINLQDYFDDVEDGGHLNWSVEGNRYLDTDLFYAYIPIESNLLVIDYKDNANGSETVTVRGTDWGEKLEPPEFLDQTFTVTVAAGQDAPTVDLTGLPALRTPEDTNLSFQGVAVGDVDFPYDPNVELVASVWVDHGALSVSNAGQATLGGGDGAGRGNALTLTGTPDEINAALAVQGNLTYDPTAQFYGTDTLHVSVDDQGNTGDPTGALTDTETAAIQVGAVKDPTIITVPGRQIVGNYGHLKFGHSNIIRVTDGDAFADSTGKGVTVTVCAKYGNLTLGSTKGIEWVMNNGGRQLTFKAMNQPAVNCALYKMDYHPHNHNYTGKIDLIKVKVRDLANQELAIKGVEVNITRAGTYRNCLKSRF